MKNLSIPISLILLSLAITAFGQKSVEKDLRKLQTDTQTLKTENERLQKSLAATSQKMETQAKAIEDLKDKTSQDIEAKTNNLENKLTNSDSKSEAKFVDVNSTLNRSTFFWIIAFILASILSIALFVWMKQKTALQKTEIENQIKQTQQTLQEESVRTDTKLSEILSEQLKFVEKQPQTSAEPDHSLVLKIANEINRMRMNILYMDPNVGGVKQLNRVLNHTITILKRNGYEIVDLLGKTYNEGMNVIASMEPDEKLEAGQEVIKRIVVPQVNFNGTAIQVAEVVVGYGE